MMIVRNAVRAAVVGLALVATVLVPCLCTALPATTAADHGCCGGEAGLVPVTPDCCACAVTPVSDSGVLSAGPHQPAPVTTVAGVSTGVLPLPASAPASVSHVASSPPPLRV
jgi:hypothetical protein